MKPGDGLAAEAAALRPEAEVRAAVEKLYDSNPQREWERAERHRTEFAITLRALLQHLPPAPCRVLDCGGGPGRYAIELARLGYEVTLFDLSAGNLALARQKAAAVQPAAAAIQPEAEGGVALAAYDQGTALDLSRYGDGSFDAVLLMGPLYHLLDEEERLRALSEARRVVKPGGPLFAAFITRFAVHRDAAAHYFTEPLALPGLYETIEQTGQLPPREGVGFVAYFAHPDEVEPLMRRAGLEVDEILGVEGYVSIIEDQGVNALTGPAWDWWLEANWRGAHEAALRGAVEHLLVVARNPAWRGVLVRVVRQMTEAGIPCKVIAGASATLHGVPLKVKDIDIETDVAGVYRCAELFGEHLLGPVTHSDNGLYRSHFARFNFDGVDVEIMGDLHRREGEGWAPTMSLTETTVELAGVRVRVPWLEEELLAYLRRGRLQRASQILPYCDRDRLLALLRGVVNTHAI